MILFEGAGAIMPARAAPGRGYLKKKSRLQYPAGNIQGLFKKNLVQCLSYIQMFLLQVLIISCLVKTAPPGRMAFFPILF
jgi:hypothetical protein